MSIGWVELTKSQICYQIKEKIDLHKSELKKEVDELINLKLIDSFFDK